MGEKTREPKYIIEISEPARVQKVQGNKFFSHDIAVYILSLSLVAFSVISTAVYLGGRGLLILRIILFILSFLLLFLIHPVTKPMPTDLCFYDKVLLIHREGRHVLGMDVCIQEYIAYEDVLFCLYDKEKMRLEVHCAYRTVWYNERNGKADPVLNEVSDDCCIVDLTAAGGEKILEEVGEQSPLMIERI